MAVHLIKQGLDLPINGSPVARIDEGPEVTRVAVLAADYPLMKPRMHVTVGDTVKRGQLLFEDRKAEGVHFTALASGTVVAINRGERRALQSLVIELDENARKGEGEQVEFEHYTGADPSSLDGDAVRSLLGESGLWTAIKARPYGRVPSRGDTPSAIFVTAIDTRPLAGSVDLAVAGRQADLDTGLALLKTLTEGDVYLCTAAGSAITAPAGIRVEQFEGKHPAGLPGTHIHVLHPVHRERTAWHLDVQDAIAMGHLARTGVLDTTRVVALGGPVVYSPRSLRTRLGASIDELVNNEVRKDIDVRVISGSPLGGRAASGDIHGFLGRYHAQVSCIAENRDRVFLGWLSPGIGKFSTVRAFASGLLGLTRRSAISPRPRTALTERWCRSVCLAGDAPRYYAHLSAASVIRRRPRASRKPGLLGIK